MALDLCWERVEDLDILKIPDNLVCTFGPYKKFPQLDIGCALISDEEELVGIASWYEQNYPTKVYVGVYANLPWIKTVMKKH